MAKRKAMDDSQIFLIAFLVMILLGASVYGLGGGGGLGSIFGALSGALKAMGLTTEGACPFYHDFGGAAWACILVFGIIPFIIIYYFTFDSLSFTFLSTRTKSMVSLGSALIASIPGIIGGSDTLLANVSKEIVQLTGMTFGSYGSMPGFFFLIIIMGLISSLLGQIGITSQMAGAAARSMQETFWGFRAMNQIGREMTREKKGP